MLAWRQQMEESLRADAGWLTLAGLFWLHEGANSLGADPESDVVLPAHAAPDRLGTLTLHGDQVTLSVESDLPVAVNGVAVRQALLRSPAQGGPDVVSFGQITFVVHAPGDRIGIRVRDNASPVREQFTGRRWAPLQPEYCLAARYEPYDPPKPMPILNVLGDTVMQGSPGAVVFTLAGHEYRLDASPSEGSGLFITFYDLTARDSTYPTGRFLRTAEPQDGRVTLDFNRAYNPPCAFTEYATCPIPPAQNRLPVRIEAGELRAKSH